MLAHLKRLHTSLIGQSHPKDAKTRGKRPCTAKRRASIAAAYACKGFPWPPTNLEYALQMLLEYSDLEYAAQKRIGGRIVDFYIPAYNIVFEADGEYWHQDKIKEKRRDSELMENGVTAVIHLTNHDLNNWIVK